MKRILLAALMTVTLGIYAQNNQQYDMSYITFSKLIKQEMTEKEYKSIDEFFNSDISGIVCYYEYGDFSGDTLDEFVVLTYENTQDLNIYIFEGSKEGTFDFVDKLSYRFWRSRYEVSILLKRDIIYITSADEDYKTWTWNKFQIRNGKLNFLGKEVYKS